MRSFTISFAKIKAKQREDHDNILTQEAERLEKLIHVQQQLITEIRNQLGFSTELAVPASVPKHGGMNLENGAQNIP